jgi:hypothetical protein
MCCGKFIYEYPTAVALVGHLFSSSYSLTEIVVFRVVNLNIEVLCVFAKRLLLRVFAVTCGAGHAVLLAFKWPRGLQYFGVRRT